MNLVLQQTNLQSVKIIIFRIKILVWFSSFKSIPKCYVLTFECVGILIVLYPYLLPIQFDKFFEIGQFKEKTNSVHWCCTQDDCDVWQKCFYTALPKIVNWQCKKMVKPNIELGISRKKVLYFLLSSVRWQLWKFNV